ncbi:MAG: hypothetical protein KDD61_14545 [Bdellovibrionales bacterium]|nr:hypothetical protein [Bdellovibrionales bacterium]
MNKILLLFVALSLSLPQKSYAFWSSIAPAIGIGKAASDERSRIEAHNRRQEAEKAELARKLKLEQDKRGIEAKRERVRYELGKTEGEISGTVATVNRFTNAQGEVRKAGKDFQIYFGLVKELISQSHEDRALLVEQIIVSEANLQQLYDYLVELERVAKINKGLAKDLESFVSGVNDTKALEAQISFDDQIEILAEGRRIQKLIEEGDRALEATVKSSDETLESLRAYKVRYESQIRDFDAKIRALGV